MEEERLVLRMVLHVKDDVPEERLKNGSFSPQNGPWHGTTAWKTPH